MYEIGEESGELEFCHNPFSMPGGGAETLRKAIAGEIDPLTITAQQYDLVCNGIELSSGAVRNHDPEIMIEAFRLVRLGEEDVKKKFPAMYNAFCYGAPPHAGIAPGVDRMVMLLAGEDSIRQKGIVVEANGKRVTVRFKKTDACGHCNACFRFGSNEADIEMDNTLGAKKGDEVYIDMHANTVLKASAIVYGIPIIGLILGVVIGSRFGEIYAAIGGVALSGLSFLILKKLEPKFAKMNEFKPRMTAFVNEEGKE